MCKYTHFYFFSPPMPIMLQPQRGKTSRAGERKGDRGRFSVTGMQQMLMGWEAERGQKTVFCIRPNFYARFSQCSLSHALTGSSNSFKLAHATSMLKMEVPMGMNITWSGVAWGCIVAHAPLQPEDFLLRSHKYLYALWPTLPAARRLWDGAQCRADRRCRRTTCRHRRSLLSQGNICQGMQ